MTLKASFSWAFRADSKCDKTECYITHLEKYEKFEKHKHKATKQNVTCAEN